jgi:hypothetical protein
MVNGRLTLDMHSEVAGRAAELARAIVSTRLYDETDLMVELVDEALEDPELAKNTLAAMAFLTAVGYVNRGKELLAAAGMEETTDTLRTAAGVRAQHEFVRLTREGRTF